MTNTTKTDSPHPAGAGSADGPRPPLKFPAGSLVRITAGPNMGKTGQVVGPFPIWAKDDLHLVELGDPEPGTATFVDGKPTTRVACYETYLEAVRWP